MYSNIQGINGKKPSLIDIMDTAKIDICLLTETMTNRVSIQNCKCVTAKTSVGQNVEIVLRNKLISYQILKLYEPNSIINMLGIRMEIQKIGVRLFTAHLKQQSTNTHNEIKDQFEEIKIQFQYASECREPMLIVMDANVHIGEEGIKNCKDKVDGGGKELMKIIKEENLILLNNMELCKGIVTRIDPRNGKKSTLDLAICNIYMEKR